MDAQQFLAEFGHIANAPGGAGRLRELILHLAMTGKLVQQSLTDESAEKLLQRIRALLLATGSRKRKDQKIVNREQTLFKEESLPSGWAIADLGELGDWGAGSTPSRNNPDFYSGDIPWFKSGELKGDLITKSEEFISELALSRCSLRVNVPGDVLIAMYGANIGQTSIVGIKSTTNQAVCACTPHEGLISRFLLLLLRALKNHFISLGAGGAQPNISKEKIIATTVGLPPTAEQVRIIAKVDELMALCDKLEQQQQQRRKLQNVLRQSTLQTVATATSPHELQATWTRLADNFVQLFSAPEDVNELRDLVKDLAIRGLLTDQEIIDLQSKIDLQDLELKIEVLRKSKGIRSSRPVMLPDDFEAPFSLPRNWLWVSLDQVCYQITDGAHHTPQYVSSGIPFLSVKDITKGVIDFSSTRFVSPETHVELIKRCKPEFGDILLTKVGTTGIAKTVDTDIPFSIFVSVALLKFPHEYVDADYLELLISSPFVKKQSLDGTRGIGNKNLVLNTIKGFAIPLPPKAEQNRILDQATKLILSCDSLESQLRNAQKLAERLSIAAISTFTGITTEQEEEPMKAPQNELIAQLRIGQVPDIKAQAPLATLLTRHNGEMSAKDLWQRFGGEIDAFYAQLKAEVAHGWIQEPEPAEMREKPPVTAEA